MITYLDTLNVTPNMPVYVPGKDTFVGMEGYVSKVNVQDDTISVAWDHPMMRSQAPLKYDASHFRDTTDRDGTTWLVLDL